MKSIVALRNGDGIEKLIFALLALLILAPAAWAGSGMGDDPATESSRVEDAQTPEEDEGPEEESEVEAEEIELPYTVFWQDESRILMKPGGGCDGECDTHADCEDDEECMMPHPCTTGGYCKASN